MRQAIVIIGLAFAVVGGRGSLLGVFTFLAAGLVGCIWSSDVLQGLEIGTLLIDLRLESLRSTDFGSPRARGILRGPLSL